MFDRIHIMNSEDGVELSDESIDLWGVLSEYENIVNVNDDNDMIFWWFWWVRDENTIVDRGLDETEI
jgi:hypothetical protein